jgi:hypothetical protein
MMVASAGRSKLIRELKVGSRYEREKYGDCEGENRERS